MTSSADAVTLNPVHTELLSQVLKLMRYQQTQRVKSIDHCFKTSINRLRDDEVYTGDEVSLIITALQDTVGNEVHTELKDANHTNGLLVQQLLTNAEQWHLTLTVDMSELENREMLNMIKNFEEKEAPEKMSITVTQSKHIIPVQDLGVALALKTEIKTLEEQKLTLQTEFQEFKDNMAKVECRERVATEHMSAMSEELVSAREELANLKATMELQETALTRNVELEVFQKDIRRMSAELERSRAMAEDEAEQLRQDLEARENKLRSVQSSLLLTEKELDKKFQATAAYANMKKILVQKNATIKTLRQRVIEAGGNPDGTVGEETPCGEED